MHFPKNKFLKKFWWIIIILLIIAGLSFFLIFKDLPSPQRLTSKTIPQSSKIYDRNGTLLYTIYGNKNQTIVPLSEIPKTAQEAAIAIEDKDFYRHGAIDLRGIIRAIYASLIRKNLQGGSTLTQQLVKTSLLTPERTITRKIKEVVLSFVTEIIYPKDKILEMYLNQIPYGGTSWGIEAASEAYFGKKASKLDLAESALLAGLPEAPTTFSPFGAHPELGKQRQLLVLQQMQEQGYITKQQQQAAGIEKIKYQPFSDRIKAPYFVLYIKDLLINKYGQQMVEEGGLQVTTSLDLPLQNKAEATVAAQVNDLYNQHVGNGAALITNPGTGEILAMVGGKGYFEDSQPEGCISGKNCIFESNVNLTTSPRQPGSSIKPINYAVGLMNKYTAATPFVDGPVCYPNSAGPAYCPHNYDFGYHGLVQMRYALGNSFNIPAVKMLKLNTVEKMITTASAMGISKLKKASDYGLSLTLGGAETTMLDMATAYAVFANGGYRIDLHPILKVTDLNKKVLDEYHPPSSPFFAKKVLPAGVAFIISDMLSDNGARMMEFGPLNSLNLKGQIVAAKTGTTNDFRDNWTIGYTPSYLVATWIGNNDNTSMGGLVSGITGAAPIWHDLMSDLLKDKLPQPFPKPDSVIQKFVCTTSGLLAPADGTPNRCQTRLEYFIKGTEPTKVDTGAMEKVNVDKTTGDLAKPDQHDNIEQKDEIIITDPLGDRYCVTCPHPTPSPKP